MLITGEALDSTHHSTLSDNMYEDQNGVTGVCTLPCCALSEKQLARFRSGLLQSFCFFCGGTVCRQTKYIANTPVFPNIAAKLSQLASPCATYETHLRAGVPALKATTERKQATVRKSLLLPCVFRLILVLREVGPKQTLTKLLCQTRADLGFSILFVVN